MNNRIEHLKQLIREQAMRMEALLEELKDNALAEFKQRLAAKKAKEAKDVELALRELQEVLAMNSWLTSELATGVKPSIINTMRHAGRYCQVMFGANAQGKETWAVYFIEDGKRISSKACTDTEEMLFAMKSWLTMGDWKTEQDEGGM